MTNSQNTIDIQLNDLQILLTKELLKTVVNREPNVSYKEIAQRVSEQGMKLHWRQVARNAGLVSELCYKLGLPMLSAKIINQNTKICGEGFFNLYKSLHGKVEGGPNYIFKKELEKIRNCDEWYRLTDYLGISVDGIERDYQI